MKNLDDIIGVSGLMLIDEGKKVPITQVNEASFWQITILLKSLLKLVN